MSYIFDARETPDQREARKKQAVMGALQSGAMQQPTDLGSGLAAAGGSGLGKVARALFGFGGR